MQAVLEVKLYGSERCHKTEYYKTFFETRNIDYLFLDVETNANHAEELISLYENRKLNFPTITICDEILRNPSDKALNKCIDRLL